MKFTLGIWQKKVNRKRKIEGKEAEGGKRIKVVMQGRKRLRRVQGSRGSQYAKRLRIFQEKEEKARLQMGRTVKTYMKKKM